jgi:hypothetical protein
MMFDVWMICALFYLCSGDAARKAAAATAEAAAQQQAVMAAVEAETKQEVVVETSAVSQVIHVHSVFFVIDCHMYDHTIDILSAVTSQ